MIANWNNGFSPVVLDGILGLLRAPQSFCKTEVSNIHKLKRFVLFQGSNKYT